MMMINADYYYDIDGIDDDYDDDAKANAGETTSATGLDETLGRGTLLSEMEIYKWRQVSCVDMRPAEGGREL